MFHITLYNDAGQVSKVSPWDGSPLEFKTFEDAVHWGMESNQVFSITDDSGKTIFMTEAFGD